jgi:hypothetical protein
MPSLYYLPNRRPADCKLDGINAAGLGYAFEKSPTPFPITSGPDHEAGVIVSADRDAGYFPQSQRWQKIPPGCPGHDAGAWVGLPHHARVRPQDLARGQQLDGHLVRLADEQRWLVPVARKALPTDEQPLRYAVPLPKAIGVDEAGDWSENAILARYAPLWAIAKDFWNAIIVAEIADDDSAALELRDVMDPAVFALQANYRISKVEVSMAALLTFEHALSVLRAVVDWPTLSTWMNKKKESTPDSSSIDSGLPAEIPVTDPPSPTSSPAA